MTGRAKHPRRASTRVSYAVARGSEDEGGEEERETDEEVVPRKRDKGRADEVFDSDEDEEDEAESSEDDASDWEESRKRTKKSKSAGGKAGMGGGAGAAKKRGRKGKDVGRLEVMKSLPLELLVEIFSHLDPNDLLALSMVNKQYRSLLTSPGSVKIWENARKKIDLPDLGADEITEWQYAQLVFGRECQKCGAKNVKKLDVYLRKRCCKSCRVKDVVKLSSLGRCYPTLKSKLHPRAADCVRKTPYVEPWLSPRFYFNETAGLVSIDDLHIMTGILRRMEEQDEDEAIAEGRSSPPPEARVRKPGSSKRKKPVAGASSKTWRAIDDDEKEEKDWESARVVNYVQARAASFDKFRDITKKLAKAAKIATEYLDSKARYSLSPWWEKPQEYEWPKKSRRKQIADRVASLGYKSHEVDRLSGKVVTSSADLTDAEWKKIKSKVLKSLELRLQVCAIKRKGEKLGKLKPPVALDPPCIVMRR
ncbi:hypothetical protein OF846_004323 [Rhodotorula toruloides]|nr:hypothetical protein OF846_004323 [Rhodotorula toruloides]